MNGIRYMYTRTVYDAVYCVVHGAVYGVLHGTVNRSYKKNIYPYRVSIRIVYVSYNGSYTKQFFTGYGLKLSYPQLSIATKKRRINHISTG